MNRNKNIKVFYNEKQVCKDNILENSYSKSPLKPMLLMKYLQDNGFGDYLDIDGSFKPFRVADFRLAHHKSYVKNFFKGVGNCRSNSIPWSQNLVESVTYTNASLYNAIKYAVDHPRTITFSPTSGFHHAGPSGGSGFCTFSGQVIAATKIYRDSGKRAAFLDLDGHFGNSIEDSRDFVQDLNESIPFNINPRGQHAAYIQDLKESLAQLTSAFVEGAVDYVVWCHGADSHEWDQLGYQCSTEEWLECSEIFYAWVASMERVYGIVVPVTLALFGGYRDDDYNSVLSLHSSDLQICLKRLLGIKVDYVTEVKPKEVQRLWYERDQQTSIEKDPTLDEIVEEDPYDFHELTAREIVDEMEMTLNETININIKNKKRVVRKAYKLLKEYNYV